MPTFCAGAFANSPEASALFLLLGCPEWSFCVLCLTPRPGSGEARDKYDSSCSGVSPGQCACPVPSVSLGVSVMMFALLCQPQLLSCNRRGTQGAGRALLGLCSRGWLQGHRRDEPFATELCALTSATMLLDHLRGRQRSVKRQQSCTPAGWQRLFPCTPEQQAFDG